MRFITTIESEGEASLKIMDNSVILQEVDCAGQCHALLCPDLYTGCECWANPELEPEAIYTHLSGAVPRARYLRPIAGKSQVPVPIGQLGLCRIRTCSKLQNV